MSEPSPPEQQSSQVFNLTECMHQPGKTEKPFVDPWILAFKHWVWTRLGCTIWGLTVLTQPQVKKVVLRRPQRGTRSRNGSPCLPHPQTPDSTQHLQFLSPGGGLGVPKIHAKCSYTHVLFATRAFLTKNRNIGINHMLYLSL